MFNTKEYNKQYRKTHKAEISKCSKEYEKTHKAERAEYRKTHKAEKAKYDKEYKKTHKAAISEYQKEYRKELKQQVIELYSHGTCKCSHCGDSVQELHHTDPANGKWELQTFKSKANTAARLHQLEMYTVIPDYITVLCKKCHVTLHKKLKAV